MSDDYISREAAISHPFANGRYDFAYANRDFIQGFVSYKEWLEDLPAADVKPVVRGEWKQTGDHSAVCTACGTTTLVGGVDRTGKALIHKGLFQFCPKCGADMRKEANDER